MSGLTRQDIAHVLMYGTYAVSVGVMSRPVLSAYVTLYIASVKVHTVTIMYWVSAFTPHPYHLYMYTDL